MANSSADGLPDVVGLRIVVTGATGFIGRRLVETLKGRGASVTALVRTGHDAAWLKSQGAEPVVAPLGGGARLGEALAGKDVLVHLAYDVRADGPENLRAFDGLMAEARAQAVGRVVHLSSAVVHAAWPEGRIDETSPLTVDPPTTYRGAKAVMEKRLETLGISCAILRPTIVYGPGSALWTDAPIAALTAGGIVLPSPVGTCALLHVDDLVQAILKAATVPGLGCEAFLISGPETPTWADLFEGYSRIAGTGAGTGKVILRPIEELSARLGPAEGGAIAGPSLAARVSAGLRRVLGRKRFEAIVGVARRLRPAAGPVWPGRSMLSLYAAHPVIVTDRARERLGFVPRITLSEGLSGICAQSR